MDSLSVQHAIQLALGHHQSGNLADAEVIYQRILFADSQHPQALHWLGLLLYQKGEIQSGIERMRRSIELAPGTAEFHSNLANVLWEQAQPKEAATEASKAIALKPDYAEAHINLGNALRALGRINEAEACYRRGATMAPQDPQAWLHLDIA